MATPPVLSIPTEIAQKIMQETLAASIAGTDHFPQPIRQDPPLCFTQICSGWRTISLNTPELWGAIRIDDDRSFLIPGELPPQVVSLWGSRAANRPRDIQLYTTDPDRAAVLLAESMKCFQRWRNISLVLPHETFTALVTHHGPFPMLRALKLSLPLSLSLSDWPVFGALTIPVKNAPLLRQVILPHFSNISVDTAWNQLKNLDITVTYGSVNDSDAARGISLLQACSNLTDLRFSLMDHRVNSFILPPVTFRSLRSLRMVGFSILRFLTVPRLTHLWVPCTDTERLATELPALLARSAGACLTQLSFHGMPLQVRTATFKRLLAAAGSVTDFQLTLNLSNAMTALRDVLHDQSEGDPVLPLLTTLRIQIAHVELTEELLEPLVETLRSRREVVANGWAVLEAFHLELEARAMLPSVVRDRFLAFRDEDMHVAIEYKS
ncbi:hypothetical protein B0H19DRAFT_1135477 [Mycena capillaripes]|nr:hypothetical protein B0H19DRAFT_1135477 [Mycena capillaripes]